MAAKSTAMLMQKEFEREAIRILPLRYCHCVAKRPGRLCEPLYRRRLDFGH